MPRPDPKDSIQAAIREAIDEEVLAEAIERALSEECDTDEVTVALREVAAEEITSTLSVVLAHARRRGRCPTGEDVGRAADERRRCGPPMHVPMASDPAGIMKVEW